MKRKPLGVSQMLLGLLFLFILTASILILIHNYKSSDKLVEEQISDTYINILEERKATIENEAVRIEAMFDTILCGEEITSLLSEENSPYWKAMKIFAFRDYVRNTTYYSDLFDVYIYGFNGIRFYYNEIMFTINRQFETTHWYREAIALPEKILWFGLCPSEVFEDQYFFIVAKQPRRLVSGEVTSLGLAYLSLNEGFLRRSLQDINREGFVHVVDLEDTIIFSSEKASIGKKAHNIDIDLGENQGAQYYIRRGKKERSLVLIGSANVYGWRIVHERPYFSLVSQFRFVKYLLYFIIAFSFLVLLLYTVVYFLKVDVPLRQLHTAMTGFSTRRLSSVYLRTQTTVKDICEEANHMLKRITLYMRKIKKIKVEIRNQELEKLQAQISPHFLNNVLNNIKFMAMLNNQPQIANVVHSLLCLLESSLDRKDKLIPLKYEIENLMHYINIVSMIYADILNSPPEPGFFWTLDHERGELPTSTVSHFPIGV